jgi:hypothetical protein
VIFAEAIPRNPAGKILKRVLREQPTPDSGRGHAVARLMVVVTMQVENKGHRAAVRATVACTAKSNFCPG